MRGGHDYARTINPTRTALETCLASLEGGRHGICFASGMGATTAVMELFAPGTRTVAINDVYGGTYRLFSKLYAPKGYGYEFADLTDEGVVRTALRAAGRPGVAGDAVQSAAQDHRHPGRRRARARGRRARRRRQHVREPVPAESARARRRHRRPLDHEVRRRPLRLRRRRGDRERRRARGAAALHPERDGRGARAARLLPHAARREDARRAHGAPLRQRGRDRALAERVAGGRRGLLSGSREPRRPRDRAAADAALRRHDRVPRARRPRGRRCGAARDGHVDAGREPRRRGEPDRAPGRDDARLARRLGLRGARRPDPPVGRASSTPRICCATS